MHPSKARSGSAASHESSSRAMRGCLTQRAPRAFTLLEMLVIITIIAILSGMLISAGYILGLQGEVTRAKTEIKAMSAALEAYKADHGAYPPLGVYTNGTVICNPGGVGYSHALFRGLSSSQSGAKSYMDFHIGMFRTVNVSGTTLLGATVSQLPVSVVADPWGSEYIYNPGGSPQITSYGPDGVVGGTDNITNLQR